MVDLASQLSPPPSAQGGSPWDGYEYAAGWGVFGLPFDTGHVLALRVFPQSSFGPYRTVWHRTPDGDWSIHVDGPHVGTACPRYYGAACAHTGTARIGLTWTGPDTLLVTMDHPELDWTLTAAEGPALRALNAVSSVLPPSSWRPAPLVRMRELLARGLGLGRLRLAGPMPSGHHGVLMPQRMYLITDSLATLDGHDLGRPARLTENPVIGEVALPARGVLAVGQAVWRIRDPEEYARTRAATVGDVPAGRAAA
ncbi:hypothetical protein [Kitasatospora cheerisanensis]|nr:hypothetical protein [Kitasatospora cheerisanensis]